MLERRRRRRAIIEPILGKRLVFEGISAEMKQSGSLVSSVATNHVNQLRKHS